ncbi:immune inhibitor A [bacterium]|nr:immune inhibitor A [bacterium]
MKKLFALIMFIVAVGFSQPLIRIGYDDFEQIASQGYDIAYVRAGAFVEIVGWQNDLEKLQTQGIQYEMIIPNLQEYYASRLDKSLDMGGYKTYDEIMSALDSLHALYPNIVSVKDSIAAGWDGNIFWAVKISDNVNTDEDEPEIFYDACIHAREVIVPEVLLYYMHWLCENYGIDPLATYLVNEREMWFIPLVNPDGYVRNEIDNPEGGGMWRKNTRDNNDNGVFDADYDGVDMNRNFGYMWGTGGSSSDPTSLTYMGPDSFSEPEIQGYRDFVISRNFRTNLSYHSYSNYYLFPWGYTGDHCIDHDYFMLYSDWMAERDGYTNGNGYDVIYQSSGVTFDWMYGSQGIFSISPEVGGYEDGFWPSTDRIIPLCQENLLANIVVGLIAGVAPRVRDYSITESIGDGDSYPDVGERVSISAMVQNYGLDDASNVSVLIQPITDGLNVVSSTATIADTISAKGGIASGDGIIIDIQPPIAPGDIVKFELIAVNSDGYWMPDTFSFTVGTPVAAVSENFDGTYLGWTTGGDWQIGTPTTGPSSAHSSPSVLATNLSGDYTTNSMSEITSPQYYISPDWFSPILSFYQWYNIEWDASYAYDGGNVQIKVGSSDWTLLEPIGDYPDTIYDDNPYLTNQPGFSGSQRNWEQVNFDLSAYAGDTIRLKFVFAADPYVTAEGWYIDDISIGGYEPETSAVVIDDNYKPDRIFIRTVPNPFNSKCSITVQNIGENANRLEITDISGRILKTYKLGSGFNELKFDADNLPTGLYFARISSENSRTYKMLLIR